MKIFHVRKTNMGLTYKLTGYKIKDMKKGGIIDEQQNQAFYATIPDRNGHETNRFIRQANTLL
ncbi:hypothetical protein Bbad01_15960 [Bacillus badius]|nr:hypothetical protein Bbad01_15960 [Bacillus badius]